MRKFTSFDTYWGEGWPETNWLARYFLAPPGLQWHFINRTADGSLMAEGADGTEGLEIHKGRVDINLNIWGLPNLGVLLYYSKWGGGNKLHFSSKGDLSRLTEIVRSFYGTPLPVGLFIPFESAWKAVKEFIETEGALPKCIEWIANRDLPPNTFPDP